MSNWNQVEAQWHVLAAQAKTNWAKLTDDDLKLIAGKRDLLVARIQERYGGLRVDAEKRVDGWAEKLSHKVSEPGVAIQSTDASSHAAAADAVSPASQHQAAPAAPSAT